jgi:hypothetical protein
MDAILLVSNSSRMVRWRGSILLVGCQPVVAAQMSVLPQVAGQSDSGHGAGITGAPAATDCARQL